ncbi:hypothetical protein QQS21_001911 [Conoideocrella luteorostrata]|uniref:Uncharacterized protein n=1 Tax=Conoideocrella luteorostrata TaxID=1105319 RepID=A0AAJ0CW35_9HYPO|nr:hypothetical protein QQS21_001911 [Conoideocrella luteorostrata]
MEPKSKTELQDLLAQLARFLKANESRISAEQVSRCLQRLSAIEISALTRLFYLLHQTKLYTTESVLDKTGRAVISRDANSRDMYADKARTVRMGGAPSTARVVLQDEVVSVAPPSADPVGRVGSTVPPSGINASQQTETTTPQPPGSVVDNGKTGLANCNQLKFAPSTERLLKDCRSDRGEFLRAIEEAKAALPTGHGWLAAIATKKENSDIRDLMRIYHRFECHNIYSHVVEAGFHTGTHWIREMRTALANKLCQGFPERFQNIKTANKCLNWVDQGCRYHEWTGILGETSDLGYLIALPSDVPHSAYASCQPPANPNFPFSSRQLWLTSISHRYTSRCTKEQMNAAATKFKALGIDELVKNLDLSTLGNYIATKLREMTGNKRKDVNEGPIQKSPKSPQCAVSSGEQTHVLPAGQMTTPPESMAGAVQDIVDNPAHTPMLSSGRGHSGYGGGEDQDMSGSLVDDFMASYGPYNNFDLSLQGYSEVFMSQFPVFSSSMDEQY